MSRRLKNCIAAALAVLGAAFVGTGIALGENEIVLRKAVNICLERSRPWLSSGRPGAATCARRGAAGLDGR
ncbi:MAG: CD1871A family CXXC motif-containing protein [Lachnospiraceae bacterium]